MTRRASVVFALSAVACAAAAGAVPGIRPLPNHEVTASSNAAAAPHVCALTGSPELDAAISEVAGSSMLRRAALLDTLARSPMCFPSDLTKEEWAAILEQFPDLLPPTQLIPFDPHSRFWTDSTVWTGAISQGPSLRATPASLTYSFPNDGVTWGLSAISSTGPNVLNARLTTLFGASDLDEGREYFRQALACWRRNSGLNYSEVADNNTAMAQDTAANPARGDIRIGGRNFGTGSFLAYNAFPSAASAGVGGSDMCINTSFFVSGAFNNSGNFYRYLRNTVAHEHGHGLASIHSVPCNSTKLMEPGIQTSTDMLAVDEIRGAQRSYGDRFAGNNSAANARDFGDLTSPTLMSIVARNLSTNGTSGFNNSDEDWFRFTLSSAENVVVSAAPIGGTYTAGQQSSSCSGSTASINASQAGNLNIELRDAAGAVVIQTASAAAAGATESLSAGTLAPGTYTVRVFDVGPNAGANQTLQLYDFTLRVATANAPPYPIIGVSKRVPANTNCFFLGDINSRAMETGATLADSGYDWDLDGDGLFEWPDTPRPIQQYLSNGVYPVTLRLTDSNGMTATDTINVTVFGATTVLNSVTPGMGDQGDSVPVTITGANLRNVTSASHVTVSGGGVTVSGAPSPNGLGTVVTGLSFDVDAGAALGARDVTVSNADGTATATGSFTVTKAPPPACPADLSGDGSVGSDDLALLLGEWGGPGLADLDGSGTVGSEDFALLLGAWGVCP